MSQHSHHQMWDDVDRAPYMAYFQYGLWDILLGLWVMLFGLSLVWHKAFLPVLAAVALLSMAWDLKKHLIVPHLPDLTYDDKALAREQKRLQMIIAALLLVLILGMVVYVGGQTVYLLPLESLGLTLLGLLLALGVGFVGYLYRALNWAVYSFALFAAVWAADVMGLPMGGCQLVVGGVILLSGMALLHTFWRNHPIA
jgi:hypothetical protein